MTLKEFNGLWESCLFHTCFMKKMKKVDWQEVLESCLKNKGKPTQEMLNKANFAETVFRAYSPEERYYMDERAAVYQYEGGFSKELSELFAFIEYEFSPDDKERLRQIKNRYRNFYVTG